MTQEARELVERARFAADLLRNRATQFGSDVPEELVTLKGTEALYLATTITTLLDKLNAAERESDETAAEALRIAERWLVKQGWKFVPADVGTRAREILSALQSGDAGRAALQEPHHGHQ